jgi:hypothetical protein
MVACLSTGAWAKDGDGGRGSGADGHMDGGVRGGDGHAPMQSAPSNQNTFRAAPSNQNSSQVAPSRDGDGQHQSFYRGPDSNQSPNRNDNGQNQNRVESFMNGQDVQGQNRDGDNRRRFTANDQFDRNGENFRRNSDAIRREFHDRNRNDLPFAANWWDRHRFNDGSGPWGFTWWHDRPWYWWSWTTAPILDTWFGWGWGRPYYWDYGPGGYVYYQDDQIYQNGQPYMQANAYYQQVYNLAHSAPASGQNATTSNDWMPLGVFAVAGDGSQQSDRMLQLAVSRQGVLSGTYFNQSNNATFEVRGMVDRDSHKAAWYLADSSNNQLVFETSVDNLTEPQSTMMVHFDPQNAQVWNMVRIERPEAQQVSAPTASPQTGAAPLP